MKRCTKCGETKPLDQYPVARTKDGRCAQCKVCRATWARQHRESNPERYHASHLRRRYGITVEQYDDLLDAQDGRCAICRTDKPGGNGRRMHVDHDHETGAVRALLCADCNNGLARFKENPELMRRAATYIEGIYAWRLP